MQGSMYTGIELGDGLSKRVPDCRCRRHDHASHAKHSMRLSILWQAHSPVLLSHCTRIKMIIMIIAPRSAVSVDIQSFRSTSRHYHRLTEPAESFRTEIAEGFVPLGRRRRVSIPSSFAIATVAQGISAVRCTALFSLPAKQS